jgi:hypothetical protein
VVRQDLDPLGYRELAEEVLVNCPVGDCSVVLVVCIVKPWVGSPVLVRWVRSRLRFGDKSTGRGRFDG